MSHTFELTRTKFTKNQDKWWIYFIYYTWCSIRGKYYSWRNFLNNDRLPKKRYHIRASKSNCVEQIVSLTQTLVPLQMVSTRNAARWYEKNHMITRKIHRFRIFWFTNTWNNTANITLLVGFELYVVYTIFCSVYIIIFCTTMFACISLLLLSRNARNMSIIVDKSRAQTTADSLMIRVTDP